MARGVNKVILVGNLGDDPETKYTQAGTAITTISIATSESWTDKQSGEKKEKTEWHRVKFFGRLAEIAGEYLEKGRQVYVEGKLQTDKYEKDGVTHYATNIIANELQMLGGGGERKEPQQQRSEGEQHRQEQRKEAPKDHPAGPTTGNRYANAGGSAKERAAAAAKAGAQDRPPVQNNEFDDDDIPFN